MSERSSSLVGDKFLPAFFVDVVELGQDFGRGEWPAHITMFPPVEQPYDGAYAEALRAACNPIAPFEVIVGDNDAFGPQNDIPVAKIAPSHELQLVHRAIAGICQTMVHDPQYRLPYNPHISHPEQFGIRKGQAIHVGGFCLTVCEGKRWQVVEKVGFRG